MPEPTASVLLLTADDDLRADVARLAAAVGVVLDPVADIGDAVRVWGAAALVLIGADAVADVAVTFPPRRTDVYVLAPDPASRELYRAAMECRVDGVLELPAAESELAELLSDCRDGTGPAGAMVAVLGGHGGAGATTFAAALARAAAARAPTLLVDADVNGAGIDQVLGWEGSGGVRWDALARSVGRLSARSLPESLPSSGGLSVLSWPVDRSFALPGSVGREVFAAARRGFEVVVVDLPRATDRLSIEALARCDHTLLITTTSLPSVATAARTIRSSARAVELVVLRGRTTAAGATEIEKVLGVPVLARMPDQRGIDEAVTLGLGPSRSGRGPLARTAALVCDYLLEGR